MTAQREHKWHQKQEIYQLWVQGSLPPFSLTICKMCAMKKNIGLKRKKLGYHSKVVQEAQKEKVFYKTHNNTLLCVQQAEYKASVTPVSN